MKKRERLHVYPLSLIGALLLFFFFCFVTHLKLLAKKKHLELIVA